MESINITHPCLTPRIDDVRVAIRCPSLDRRDGLCWEFQVGRGRQRYTNRCDVVFCRQSEVISETIYNLDCAATDVLVDQDDANVFPLFGEAIECRLNGGSLRLAVYYEEVLLSFGARCYMLPSSEVCVQ